MTIPPGGDVKTGGADAQPPAHPQPGESCKLDRVRAFVAAHGGKPLTLELIEAINTGRAPDEEETRPL